MSDSKINKYISEWDNYKGNHPYNDAYDFATFMGLEDLNDIADVVDTISYYEEIYY